MGSSLPACAVDVCLASVRSGAPDIDRLRHNRGSTNHFEGHVEQVDAVVIGAGVVGLAVGRALAMEGREVMVLESENAIGTGTSARNSEVIHAGIYYPAGSLKARLCVQGKQMLYAYCAERGVSHRQLGKLIVATSAEQVQALDGILRKAAANGVHDLQKLSAAEARALEPALACEAALLSPSSGVVDSHGLMLALQGDMENAGGLLALLSPVQHIGAVSYTHLRAHETLC
jgi:L-2-hydroxyglutarate oxidase LhgO